MKTEGTLVMDGESGRMVIRYGLEEYSHGLHCGTPLEVRIRGRWMPTRIEYSGDWYLVGVETSNLAGVIVRER